MGRKIFITGIGTDVGKTIVSAILTEAWQADYWKPLQAGNLDQPESATIASLISNSTSVIHPTLINLQLAASPHIAAEKENRKIEMEDLKVPFTTNNLLIEGAGGIMVPLNRSTRILDWIKKEGFEVVLVSRHYLGSINHTLLSIEVLKQHGINLLGVIFNDTDHFDSASVIKELSGAKVIGSIPHLESFEKNEIKKIAEGIQKLSEI
jgi:dethiobiotin synthetase